MDLRPAIKTLQEPFIIKNRIKQWPILHFDESQWCKCFPEKELTFRKGCNKHNDNPRWEKTCGKAKMSLQNFFEISRGESQDWLYYDYKDMNTVFERNQEVLKAVKWEDVGFPEAKESTIWIGNTGAHTPCHMDSYGHNLVAQLYGRKLWILIPPEETDKLRLTRVPYEESSIYSDTDMFTPTLNMLELTKIYKVILEPGDVLHVPRHWWHYVENLQVAISVNTWIPADDDDESRLDEALVQRYVWSVCQDLTEEEATQILNPNENELLTSPPSNQVLHAVAEACLKARARKTNPDQLTDQKLNSDISILTPITKQELRQYVTDKVEKHKYDPTQRMRGNPQLSNVATTKLLINSFCHPDAIRLVKEKLLKQFH